MNEKSVEWSKSGSKHDTKLTLCYFAINIIISNYVCSVKSDGTNETICDVKDLEELDKSIYNIIENASKEQIKLLLFYMESFAKLLKQYIREVTKGNSEINEKVSSLMEKGGPSQFFQNNLYPLETEFRCKINFSDVEYQEYLFLRAITKERWDSVVLKVKNITC